MVTQLATETTDPRTMETKWLTITREMAETVTTSETITVMVMITLMLVISPPTKWRLDVSD